MLRDLFEATVLILLFKPPVEMGDSVPDWFMLFVPLLVTGGVLM